MKRWVLAALAWGAVVQADPIDITKGYTHLRDRHVECAVVLASLTNRYKRFEGVKALTEAEQAGALERARTVVSRGHGEAREAAPGGRLLVTSQSTPEAIQQAWDRLERLRSRVEAGDPVAAFTITGRDAIRDVLTDVEERLLPLRQRQHPNTRSARLNSYWQLTMGVVEGGAGAAIGTVFGIWLGFPEAQFAFVGVPAGALAYRKAQHIRTQELLPPLEGTIRSAPEMADSTGGDGWIFGSSRLKPPGWMSFRGHIWDAWKRTSQLPLNKPLQMDWLIDTEAGEPRLTIWFSP